jgi:transcription elongation factor SPT5
MGGAGGMSGGGGLGGIGSATPMHGGRTPAYGSQTPMHGDQTPMHGSATPHRGDETPGHESAWNPSAYAPAAFEENQRSEYISESPLGATPANGNVFSTPSAYAATGAVGSATPGGLMDTGTPGGADLAAGDHGTASHLSVGVVVRIGDTDTVATIAEVLPESRFVVRPATDVTTTLTLPADQLSPMPPVRTDLIMVLAGDLAGATGRLIGVDGSDGIVEIDQDIKILEMDILAKYEPPAGQQAQH